MEHLEGRLSVLAALEARRRRFDLILVAHGAHAEKLEDLLAAAERAGVPVKYASREQLDDMAHGHTHGGVIAVCTPKPRTTFDQLLAQVDTLQASNEPPLLLLLEGIDDARNLGFTIRTAEAMGAHAVLVKKHLWDFEEVDVARPSSGAYERMTLVQFDTPEPLRELQKRRIRIYGCIANVKRTVYTTDLARPAGVCLAIGGEKRGLSGAVRKICDRFLTVPSVPGAASLSLSAAAAVVLSETRRQRLMAANSPLVIPPPKAPPDEIPAEEVVQDELPPEDENA